MNFGISSEEEGKKVAQFLNFKDFKENEEVTLTCPAELAYLAIPIAHNLNSAKKLKYSKVEYNGDKNITTIILTK